MCIHYTDEQAHQIITDECSLTAATNLHPQVAEFLEQYVKGGHKDESTSDVVTFTQQIDGYCKNAYLYLPDNFGADHPLQKVCAVLVFKCEL